MDTSKLQNLTSVQPAKNNRITGRKEGKESNYRALYPSQQQDHYQRCRQAGRWPVCR